jgi:sensor histidine kinase YesM
VSKYDFIFSNRFSHRLARHLAFWTIFLIYFFYTNFFPSKPEDLADVKTYRSAFELMIFLPVSVISVYTSIYFLLPRYILTGKYFGLIVVVAGLTVFYFSLAWLLTVLLAGLTRDVPFGQLPVSFQWFLPIRYGIGLPLTSAVLTTIIKLMKIWHQKQEENDLLQRQKINNELQLLKTQFQPHFLYDSLQHIYYLIRKHSSQSSETILRLSDLLSYILYENEKEHVPLERELEILKTYLSIKKTFYPDRFWIQLKLEGDAVGKKIEPLLLVSMIENCFQEFLHRPQQQLTLDIDIRIKKDELYFLMKCTSNENGLAEHNLENHWDNSLKRIGLLYPARHSFDMFTENGATNFLLVLEPDESTAIIQKEKEETVLS